MDKNNKRLRIILSIVALIEIVVLISGITFSWIVGGTKGAARGDEITVSTNSSLIMINDQGKTTSSIQIPACDLDETSSADGRNFFFPMADNTTNKTDTMTYRKGTMSDKNKKYVSLDFYLKAADVSADVFLGAGTVVKTSNETLAKSLKMSFSMNDGSTPIVFKPNQMPGVTSAITYSPITAINEETGSLKATGTTETKAYGDYYYKGAGSTNSLFHIGQNETKHITMSLWLEGTVQDFENAVANNDINVYVDFSTTVDDLVKYNFVDNTHNPTTLKSEYWITNKDSLSGQTYDTMMYIFDNSSQRYYAMSKDDNYSTNHTWTAYIPKTITDFSFRRYCIDIDTWWNQWPGKNIKTDSNGEHTYVAVCGTKTASTGTKQTPCGGYWKDEYGTYRIYFQDSLKKGYYAYCSVNGGTYKSMTYFNSVQDGYRFYIDVKETDNPTSFQFKRYDGTTTSKITKGTNFDPFVNGFAYWYESYSQQGYWLYTDSSKSMIFD